MKTKIVVLLVIGIVAMFVAGCEKDDIVIDENQNLVDDVLSDENRPKSLGEFVPEDDQFFKENVLDYDYESESNIQKSSDAMYDIVNNALSVWSIPTYAFRCYDNYKWAYRHVRQPNGTSCSWTSYVICTGNIAAVCGHDYPVNVDQVYLVKNGCGGSKLITKLRDYANTTDRNIVKARTISLQKSTTESLSVFKKMMLLMYVNKTPFVTIAMSGNYTHYVTIYSIYWKRGIIGSKIYFTDSLDPDRGSFDKNVKYMDLWDFYCAMKNNANSYYNFLELLPR
ncbi:MAG: hypothetical protein PHR61_05030 [Candidatus Absconditabacteria bacterium]|nr:hypothetical protein [Candidatus Absconditabacteria bacterium]